MMFRIKLCSLLMIVISKTSSGQAVSCHRSEYQIGNECCPMCGVGYRVKTDCEGEKSTSCQPCSDGTFMNKLNGLKSCFSCSMCGEAAGLRIKKSCTKSSDSVCEPLEDFFCTQPEEDGCGAAQRHRSCDPGYFISQEGTSVTDAECLPCSDGKFSNGTFTFCRKHKECDPSKQQLLRPGTGSQDAECEDLKPGTTNVIVGAVVGVFAVLFLVLCILAWRYRKKIQKCLNREKSPETVVVPMETEGLNGR